VFEMLSIISLLWSPNHLAVFVLSQIANSSHDPFAMDILVALKQEQGTARVNDLETGAHII
jgi:hypothetical protein